MSLLTRNLRQTATYWAPATVDAFGFATYARSTMKCRWQDKNELFIDASGAQVVSQAVVYLESDVLVNGFLFLGTSLASDPGTVSGAWRIRAFGKTPNLQASQFERKAVL